MYSDVFYVCIAYDTVCFVFVVFFFKQKTAYEMRISDWSSDVCSSDLLAAAGATAAARPALMNSLIVTAKMNDVDPQAWLADVLACIAELPQSRQIGRASCRERVCQYV